MKFFRDKFEFTCPGKGWGHIQIKDSSFNRKISKLGKINYFSTNFTSLIFLYYFMIFNLFVILFP